ncbi:MAG TPA: hypothetical protein VEG62_02860 [Acidimicrobiales bacterium]|nr:hypothetical protein [Acidimicrobiales bacterium]
MTEFDLVGGGQGYTTEAVEAYLLAIAQKRSELRRAIDAARARRNDALELERRVSSLERRVGNEIVSRLAAGRTATARDGSHGGPVPGPESHSASSRAIG